MRRRLFEQELQLIVEEILSQTIGVSRAERRRIIHSYAQQHGVAERLLYKITREQRMLAYPRNRRADAGTRRRTVPHLDDMFRLTIETDMPAPMVLNIAELNNWIQSGELTPADYNRLLREYGIPRARLNSDVKPARIIEATAPNQVWQFDPTKLEQLHFDQKRKTIRWDPRANRRNSRGEPPLYIWLYALIDDYSRVKFADIYLAKNIFSHLDFWYAAISPKTNPHEFPFRGFPQHSYQDNDASNVHWKMKAVYKGLPIHMIPTDPSFNVANAARKRGKIENGQKGYNEWIKIFRQRELSWEEGRAALRDYLLNYNNRAHSTTGKIPFSRWSELIQPAEVPSERMFKLFYDDKRECHVDRHLVARIDNRWYYLDPQSPDPQNPERPQSFVVDWTEQKVHAYMKPGAHTGKIDVYRGGRHAVAREVQRGDLVRPYFVHGEPFPKTAVEQARERLTGTYDGPPLKLYPSDPTPPAGGLANSTEPKRPAYIVREGEPFDESRLERKGPEEELVASDFRAKIQHKTSDRFYIPKNEVRRMLRYELGFFSANEPLTESQAAWLDRLMAGREKIEEDEVREAVNKAKAEMNNENE